MRLTRVAAAATSLLLLGASTTIGSASAPSTGVGTSNTSTTGTDSGTAAASSSRSVVLDDVTVLDLGAVLRGLGIPLVDLTVDQVDGLLADLQTTVNGLGAGATLNDTIDAVQAEITTLQA